MEQVRIYSIAATVDRLDSAARGEADEQLSEPIGVMAAELASRAHDGPLSVYLCSDPRYKKERDLLGLALGRAIIERLPDALVVDCDFLDPGLSGMVPTSDQPGFLDLVLYGSSLKVTHQRAKNGVGVVGAGSFPVSTRTPFLRDAFEESVRYLCRAAGCVILCGPMLGDDEELHPIVLDADIPILLGIGSGSSEATMWPAEETVVGAVDSPVWSVRIGDSAPTPVSLTGPDADGVMNLDSEVDQVLEADIPDVIPKVLPSATVQGDDIDTKLDGEIDRVIDVPFDEEGPMETLEGKSWDSAFPKIVTTTLAVFLIGFLLWWLYLTKSMRDQAERPLDAVGSVAGTEQPIADRSAAVPADVDGQDVATDSLNAAQGLQRKPSVEAEQIVDGRTTTPDVSQPSPPEPATTTIIRGDLTDYPGKYFVHVSSFRGTSRVDDDSAFLSKRGHDIFVTRVDLGSKGLWYRVYVGPFETEDEAANAKITLDENPRFRSTRITKAPSASTPNNES